MSAPSRPLNADDLDAWGDTWWFNGGPERVQMCHGRAVFRLGVVLSTREALWAGPYAHTTMLPCSRPAVSS